MWLKVADGMANSVDPDQTAWEQSDLGLHCLLRPVYPSILTIFMLLHVCVNKNLLYCE